MAVIFDKCPYIVQADSGPKILPDVTVSAALVLIKKVLVKR
jgi:hypothetical protein